MNRLYENEIRDVVSTIVVSETTTSATASYSVVYVTSGAQLPSAKGSISSNSFSHWYIILFAVLAVLLAAGGAYLFQKGFRGEKDDDWQDQKADALKRWNYIKEKLSSRNRKDKSTDESPPSAEVANDREAAEVLDEKYTRSRHRQSSRSRLEEDEYDDEDEDEYEDEYEDEDEYDGTENQDETQEDEEYDDSSNARHHRSKHNGKYTASGSTKDYRKERPLYDEETLSEKHRRRLEKYKLSTKPPPVASPSRYRRYSYQDSIASSDSPLPAPPPKWTVHPLISRSTPYEPLRTDRNRRAYDSGYDGYRRFKLYSASKDPGPSAGADDYERYYYNDEDDDVADSYDYSNPYSERYSPSKNQSDRRYQRKR
ncbi:hypothetical protein V1511DRAFT_496767 [Dipodascopsis uninucleata]